MTIMASYQAKDSHPGVLCWSAVAWAELGRWAAPVQVEDVGRAGRRRGSGGTGCQWAGSGTGWTPGVDIFAVLVY